MRKLNDELTDESTYAVHQAGAQSNPRQAETSQLGGQDPKGPEEAVAKRALSVGPRVGEGRSPPSKQRLTQH